MKTCGSFVAVPDPRIGHGVAQFCQENGNLLVRSLHGFCQCKYPVQQPPEIALHWCTLASLRHIRRAMPHHICLMQKNSA